MANYRNRKLLDLCRGEACYLAFPNCEGFNTVPCHSNMLRHGRGFSYKSHDVYVVPGCPSCHRELDALGNYTREQKEQVFMSAWERWMLQLFQKEFVDVT